VRKVLWAWGLAAIVLLWALLVLLAVAGYR
jgi:hypothetical protein